MPAFSLISGVIAARGPPNLPDVMSAMARAWRSSARSSTIRPTLMSPSAIGPGECIKMMKLSPSRDTPSFSPLPIRMATAALQSPSVGLAVRLEPMQGQMKSQLQVSMYCPSICQPAMFATSKRQSARSSRSPGHPWSVHPHEKCAASGIRRVWREPHRAPTEQALSNAPIIVDGGRTSGQPVKQMNERSSAVAPAEIQEMNALGDVPRAENL
ncbi:hypothetical protein KBTX_04110 [wastewater metagenome]|uniref:Uncharacterized protein n=2 Tax=unclassified sequences TaxID=12908 RepID=A0A5B8RIG0_9ZZZZ|nr:hypothetical protein KBTEX_04110 [uncultured organism]